MRILLTFLFISLSLFAQTNESLFLDASQNYEQNNFNEALNSYLEIENSGSFSSELYYNIANCYYKKQQLAPAVLYYEKALKLNPYDEDARFNLSLVNVQLVDKLAKVPQAFYKTWLHNIKNFLSIDQWSKIGLSLLLLFCILFVSFLFSSNYKTKKKTFSLSALFLVFALFSLAMSYYAHNTQITEAILMQDNAYVKSAPSLQSEDLFILHEGTKIQVLENFNDWTKIKLSDGMIGWLESNSVTEI